MGRQVVRSLAACLMFIAALLTSCQTTFIGEGPWVKKIDSEALSYIVLNWAAKMKKEHHLELEDSWVAYDDYVKKICVEFSSQRLVTLCEARLLIVEVVDELLNRLNHHTVVAFELDHYPFTASDVDVKINFESFYGFYIDELYIGLIWLQAGCNHFYAFDRKDRLIDWSHQRFEPYFKSRELALIKREADLPYMDEFLSERYREEDRYFSLDEGTPPPVPDRSSVFR